jgi:hypothetical protein
LADAGLRPAPAAPRVLDVLYRCETERMDLLKMDSEGTEEMARNGVARGRARKHRRRQPCAAQRREGW